MGIRFLQHIAERLFEKLALTLCDVIIAQSKGVREYMLKLYGSAIESKIQIIPTGVDHTKFLQLPKLTGDKEILFVGALSEIKGVNGLITSFSRVHHKLDDSKLVLAGSGPNAPRYEKLVRELKLENSVEFLGPVRDDRRMIELYRNSNVVVLPSNVGGPISCTILEGLSSGRPVISTNVPGGIPDVVDDAVGGLIAPEDIDGLTEKLFRFLQDKEYADQIGYNARQRIVEKYTLDLMIDELLSLYTELAA